MATLVPEQLIAPYMLKIPHLLPGSRTQEMQNWQALQVWANAFIQFSDVSSDRLYLSNPAYSASPSAEIAWTQQDVLQQTGTSIALLPASLGAYISITTDGNYAMTAGVHLNSGSASVTLNFPSLAIAAVPPSGPAIEVVSLPGSSEEVDLSVSATSFLPAGTGIAVGIVTGSLTVLSDTPVTMLVQRLS